MSRTAAGVLTGTAAVLCEKVKAEAICFEPDGVRDAVVSRVPLTPTALKHLPLPQDVPPNNPTEGVPELSDAVGVDEGVDHRVGMG